MKKVFVSLCMAGTLVGLSSCGSTKQAVSLTSMDGEWNIIELNGTAVVPAPGQGFPYIGFDSKKGDVYGHSGCNRFMGSFDVNAKPGKISFGPLGTTRMACPDMTLERNVLTALAQVKKYKSLGKGNWALCGSSSRPLIVLQKREKEAVANDLSGKWLIREVAGEIVPQVMENQPFVEFDMTAKRLHGNAGCNIINGAVVTDEKTPEAVSFPQVISTMMACPDQEIEGRILNALNETRSFGWQPDGNMVFYGGDGALLLVLSRN